MNMLYHSTTQEQLSQVVNNPYKVYLLYGQNGSGKYEAARGLAATILQEDSVASSYDFVSPNLFIVEPQEGKQLITIEQIRTLIHQVWKTAVDDNGKVVVVRGVELLTESAANALLKNLEDIAPNTTFLLIADSLTKVLATIRSRSQLIYFAELTDKDKLTYLQQQTSLDTSTAQALLQQSHGRLLFALRLFREEDSNELYQEAKKFINGTITMRFALVKKIAEQKQAKTFLTELVYTIRSEYTILSEVKLLEAIMQAQEQLDHNINARLVLENMSLR